MQHLKRFQIFNEERSYVNVDFVTRVLNNIKSELIGKNLGSLDIELLLNKAFDRYDVQFKDDYEPYGNSDFAEVGITHGSIDADGYVTVGYNSSDFYKTFDDDYLWNNFINTVKSIISHELTHRNQLSMNRINTDEIIPADMSTAHSYMSDKRELQAFARQAIQDFLNVGYTKEQILRLLKGEKTNAAHAEESGAYWYYHDLKRDDPKTWTSFKKHMYQLLTTSNISLPINAANMQIHESMQHLKHVYHVLDLEKLEYVLKHNSIKTYHFHEGISTTRNRYMNNYVGAGVTSWFKFQMDYSKLNQSYKNKKFVYVSRTNVKFTGEEEQLFQTSEITPAFDYIEKVILIKPNLERSMKYFNDDERLSDWMSNAPTPERKIPHIIKHIVQELQKYNCPLYVQEENGVIKRDDDYLNHIINHPLQDETFKYAYIYRKYERIREYNRDVFYCPKIKKMHETVIGHEYPVSDFTCVADSVKELRKKFNFPQNPDKDQLRSLPNRDPSLYVATFRKISDKEYKLEDLELEINI